MCQLLILSLFFGIWGALYTQNVPEAMVSPHFNAEVHRLGNYKDGIADGVLVLKDKNNQRLSSMYVIISQKPLQGVPLDVYHKGAVTFYIYGKSSGIQVPETTASPTELKAL